jgi:hypothetical protein
MGGGLNGGKYGEKNSCVVIDNGDRKHARSRRVSTLIGKLRQVVYDGTACEPFYRRQIKVIGLARVRPSSKRKESESGSSRVAA